MPFDDLKTLPEGFAETPTMQPVAWAVQSRRGIDGVFILQAVAMDFAGHCRNQCRVFPLYAAPVAVPADQPPKPSGVASATATAADVAQTVCPAPAADGTDWPTSGAGPTPDVGEGWRLLEVGETIQDGDCRYQDQEWEPCCISVGRTVTEQQIAYGICYRRRVTPEAPQSRPAETRASSRHHVIDYDRETREWNERADAELARRAAIPSEVARLRAENATLRSGVELLSAENAALRSQVERLRLTPDEANAILEAAGDDASESGGMPLRAATLRGIAKRQGGGE